jgi:hypothetical protein
LNVDDIPVLLSPGEPPLEFLRWAKLSKIWTIIQYIDEKSSKAILLQDPGGGRAAWVLKN